MLNAITRIYFRGEGVIGGRDSEAGGGVLGEGPASPAPPAKGSGGALKAPPVHGVRDKALAENDSGAFPSL